MRGMILPISFYFTSWYMETVTWENTYDQFTLHYLKSEVLFFFLQFVSILKKNRSCKIMNQIMSQYCSFSENIQRVTVQERMQWVVKKKKNQDGCLNRVIKAWPICDTHIRVTFLMTNLQNSILKSHDKIKLILLYTMHITLQKYCNYNIIII